MKNRELARKIFEKLIRHVEVYNKASIFLIESALDEHLPHWQKVEDELPEVITAKDGSTNSVLIYKKNGFESGSNIQVTNTVFLLAHKKWVTHWMPLPEPPKEEK